MTLKDNFNLNFNKKYFQLFFPASIFFINNLICHIVKAVLLDLTRILFSLVFLEH